MPTVFAYGPDTFRKRMFDRVGTCEVLGAAILNGHGLLFNKPNIKNTAEGLSNLVPTEGESVNGVLFELSRRQLEMLEGYFGGYGTRAVKVKPRKSPTEIAAQAFIARRTGRNLLPSKATIDLSVRGAEENGLPRDFIERLKGLNAIDG